MAVLSLIFWSVFEPGDEGGQLSDRFFVGSATFLFGGQFRFAEPLMRRAVKIFYKSCETTGHEHPQMQAALGINRGFLTDLELSGEEIDRRLRRFV